MYSLKNNDVGTGYDAGVRDYYQNDYEFNRWFIRSRNRAEYAMTYASIKKHLVGIDFANCLEVGPGPGTWTRLVYRANPKASLDLVDISEAMREQFCLEMRESSNVNYEIMDVMKYQPDTPYDLFFSSRAVEYFDDKPGFFTKLSSLIRAGGAGVIITKNPYHGIRKDKGAAHQGQISMPAMKKMLEENGFTDVSFYPTVIRIPMISRLTSEVAEYIHEKNIDKKLSINATNRIVESYTVVFKKPAQ